MYLPNTFQPCCYKSYNCEQGVSDLGSEEYFHGDALPSFESGCLIRKTSILAAPKQKSVWEGLLLIAKNNPDQVEISIP